MRLKSVMRVSMFISAKTMPIQYIADAEKDVDMKNISPKEAIKTLIANYPDTCFEQLREAVDAAIEALKAQDADSDTISRQAAIDAHYEYCNKHPDAGFPVWSLKILEDLPSAQPDVPDTNVGDTISRQVVVDTVHKIILGFFSEKNGAMTDTEKTLLSVNKAICNALKAQESNQLATNLQPCKQDADDLISRAAAIDVLHNEIVRRRINEDSNDDGALDEFDTETILRRLPSAQPQRTGQWIDHAEEGYVECPFCHSATNCDDNISELHFCFSCGARMEGEQE